MIRLIAGLIALLVATPTFAQSVLYDSGSVAAGAAITSPVLNFEGSRVRQIQVLVTNTAGTALRQLTMTSLDRDGSTTIDTVPLRLVSFGAAPTGSVFAPGSVRGYVGPMPAPVANSGRYTLWRDTSAANTALVSPTLTAEDCTEVTMLSIQNTGGATHTCLLRPTLDDGTPNIAWENPTTSAASGPCAIVQGQGTIGNLGGNMVAGMIGVSAMPLRRFVTTTGASTVGTTTTEVTCVGRPPGTFSVQMLLPPKATITLASGGSGAAQVRILAYLN